MDFNERFNREKKMRKDRVEATHLDFENFGAIERID